ncbi:MAG: 3'(2'),5'-bisphosphate nucleotidase CysQ [Bacteroidota bacterium]
MNVLLTAIEAAIAAGPKIMDIYNQPNFDVKIKENNSPLTEADISSNAIIRDYLVKTGIPIISEEDKNLDYAQRKIWQQCWIVDPLDGTKEFLKKNGEFTVNIALCDSGTPTLGVIYVPAKRELYYADVKKRRAFKLVVGEEHQLDESLFYGTSEIKPSIPRNDKIRVVASRSHMNQKTSDFIEELKLKYDKVEIVSRGSSLKLCLVASGEADIYPRFAPTMEWDTAAGQAICNAVGLKVIDQNTQEPLRYNKENLLNPHFLVSF